MKLEGGWVGYNELFNRLEIIPDPQYARHKCVSDMSTDIQAVVNVGLVIPDTL